MAAPTRLNAHGGGRGAASIGAALLLAGAGAPFLLMSSPNRTLSTVEPSYAWFPPLPPSGESTPVPECPPFTTYGLRPVEGVLGFEGGGGGGAMGGAPTTAESRGRRRLGGEADQAEQRPAMMEMGCVPHSRVDAEDATCVNALPYGILHDDRLDEVQNYQQVHVSKAAKGPPLPAASVNYDMPEPELTVLPPGSSFASWDCRHHEDRCDSREEGGEQGANGVNLVKVSAWTAQGVDMPEGSWEKNKGWMFLPHKHFIHLWNPRRHTTTLTGADYVAHAGFNPTNFGHILHDNLPLVAWLKAVSPPTSRFLLPKKDLFQKLVRFIDPDFYDRVHWYDTNEVVVVRDGTLTIADHHRWVGDKGNTLWRYFRHWVAEHHPSRLRDVPPEERTIVYYARGAIPGSKEHDDAAEASAGTRHGRILDPKHEREVVATIRSKMAEHGRREKLVFFTGSDETTGKILPYEDQLSIFRSATSIIGPHGSGLANAVWTDPFPPTCEDKVKMLEFIPARDSENVQTLYNGYYWVMRGLPVEWHQIAYTAESTKDMTYVRLTDLERALDDMWGPKS